MAINYNSYFDKIPKIKYDINHSLINQQYDDVTNVFFRVRVLQNVLDNINSYYVAEIEEGETPEILSEKVYKDPGGNWIILIANRILDPQWDWPVDSEVFKKFIIDKYGSIETAKTTDHHYEMIVTRKLMPDDITTTKVYEVSKEKLTENNLTVPFNYYVPVVVTKDYLVDNTNIKVDTTLFTADSGAESQDPGEIGLQPGSLAYAEYYSTYNIDGKTVQETIRGRAVSYYDWEDQKNEDRRLIKVIKREYYQQILNELNNLTGTNEIFSRRVV